MRAILLAMLVMLLFSAAPSVAGAGCPTRMDRLDDFARCMTPMRGTIGTTSIYSSGQYDEDHRKLMEAMAMQAMVPPQVVPAYPYPTVPYMPYYYSPASFYFRAGMNPYFWMSYHY